MDDKKLQAVQKAYAEMIAERGSKADFEKAVA